MELILHFARGGSKAPERFGDLKAVVFSLIEEHSDQIVQENPGRQTQQPLAE